MRTIASAIASALLVIVMPPTRLGAHAHLERSMPKAGERLTSAPSSIRLWFSERPELAFTRVTLIGADGGEVALDAVRAMGGEARAVEAAVRGPLRSGAYVVKWQTAGSDGHPSSGRIPFTLALADTATTSVRAESVGATASARPPNANAIVGIDRRPSRGEPAMTSPAVRWAELIGVLGTIGAVAVRLLVLRRVEGDARRIPEAAGLSSAVDAARRFGVASVVLYALAAMTRLANERRAMESAMGASSSTAPWRMLVTHTAWGRGWLVGAAGAALAALALLASRRNKGGWLVAAIGALAVATSPALTGHASAAAPVSLSIGADVAHVLGAGGWIGTLLVLIVAVLPALGRSARTGGDAEAIARAFHPVALGSAGLVVASGLASTATRLTSVAALWDSGYGRLLLLKLLAVAIVMALGALNWRRVLPALSRPEGVRRLRRSASVELIVAGIVVALTALLVSSPLPS